MLLIYTYLCLKQVFENPNFCRNAQCRSDVDCTRARDI